MTDFRHMHSLHAYSGGTVRDFHTILYSPVGLLPHPQALKRQFNYQNHITVPSICQGFPASIRDRTVSFFWMLGMPPKNSVDRLAAVVAKEPM